ncbi:cytidine deaminase [Mesoplasma corruscae]|uniref:Cytidine deaminase n=1 Tax=Mesoplasma corruscae TaxID=216874 RepID=A0A2S5RGR8_9MOLU|nr:cytidine deaminase [Mesoplasma corruscae]PPE06529.1 cytidine deaminase [Mesoplasma corruscae]
MKKEELFEKLLKLKNNAYSPYSNFKVACIIRLKNQDVVKGVNIESASYSPTICAERAAISQLYALGWNEKDIEEFSLYTDSENLGTPCGVCRQVMSELLNPLQEIVIFNKHGYIKTIINQELLPYAFSSNDLKS